MHEAHMKSILHGYRPFLVIVFEVRLFHCGFLRPILDPMLQILEDARICGPSPMEKPGFSSLVYVI